MRPVALFITLQAVTEEIKSASGLVLTGDDAKAQRYKKAIVLGVGNDVPKVQEGDTVLYDSSNTFTMVIDKAQVTICTYRDIVGVF